MKSSPVALVFALATASCAPQALGTPSAKAAAEVTISEPTPSPSIAKPTEPKPKSGEPDGAAAKAPVKPVSASFAESNNALAMELYSQLGKNGGDLVFSPASIESAFVMAYAGARGATASEMQKVLHLSADRDEALKNASSVMLGYQGKHSGYELDFADKLFGDKSYPFDPGFIALSKTDFGASLTPLDFVHHADAGRLVINDYVSKNTKGKIKDLLAPGSLDETTSLVLVNAVYMHADWAQPFNASETSSRKFDSGTTSSMVDTMHNETELGYAETSDAQVLDMPYQGGDLAMTIILPKAKDGLSKVEGEVEKNGAFVALASSTHARDVDVALPKFSIGGGSAPAVAIGDIMKSFGMPLAFDAKKADFSGMIGKDGKPLHIADAFHKAFIAVAEKGTEAAAATLVVVAMPTAVVAPPPDRVSFTADHPFMYVIRDTHTNLILFVGRVATPHV